MASDNYVQIIGALGQDPELRYTTAGTAVCSFSVAWTPRRKNSQTGEWEDGDTSWFRCNVWRDQAENVAASLTKGMRVVVTGQVKARDWTDNDGNKRTSVEIDVDEVAPSLRWATAEVSRVERENTSSGAGRGGGGTGRRSAPDPIYTDEEPF